MQRPCEEHAHLFRHATYKVATLLLQRSQDGTAREKLARSEGRAEGMGAPGRKSKFLRTASRMSLSGMVPVP